MIQNYLSVTFNTAAFDSRQNQPGRAVAQGKGPAADDDLLGSTQGTDVLQNKGPYFCLQTLLKFRKIKGILVV